MTSFEHEQAGMSETPAERASRVREERIEVIAAAITTPYAQPQTRRKLRRYARRAVQGLEAWEARGGGA